MSPQQEPVEIGEAAWWAFRGAASLSCLKLERAAVTTEHWPFTQKPIEARKRVSGR